MGHYRKTQTINKWVLQLTVTLSSRTGFVQNSDCGFPDFSRTKLLLFPDFSRHSVHLYENKEHYKIGF